MTTLNRHASHIALYVGAHALTDITGYSLAGHAREIAAASGVCLRIVSPAVPVLPGTLEYAKRGITTGGAARNRSFFGTHVRIDGAVSEAMTDVLFDPQTSGGLLMAVGQVRAAEAQAKFQEAGLAAWVIGEVVAGEGVEVVG
jgi:selenide,water dikinase